MKKTTKNLVKAMEYGVDGLIWSYDYAQFMKIRENAFKRVNTLDKDASSKDKAKAYASLCGACFMETFSCYIATSMFTNAVLTGAKVVGDIVKKK